MELLLSVEVWTAFLTLTVLEIILGIDNIIFLTVLVARLPDSQRETARKIGLLAAMGTRILLLLGIAWVVHLTNPLFSVLEHPVSIRDLILIGGGLFLIVKATLEIHSSLEEHEEPHAPNKVASSFAMVIVQIAIIDIIFSLDSVITAVGLVEHVEVMIAAIVVAIGVMMLAAKSIGDFVEEHPTMKMLALSFLILVGTVLVAEGFGFHIPKGYLYFAIAFSLSVEFLNLRIRKKRKAAAAAKAN